MDEMRELIRAHPYPQCLDFIAREFRPQWDEASCGLAALRHGLLLGGLTVPEGTLGAIFGRTYPDGIDLSEKTSLVRLRELGFDPVNLTMKPPRQQTPQFLEQLGHEMDRGAFVLACIYGGWHWITVGRWQTGRIRVVDSYVEKGWFRAGIYDVDMYNLTPGAFDYWDWENSVLLVRPGDWQKNYEEWLPGRDRLLRLEAVSKPRPGSYSSCECAAVQGDPAMDTLVNDPLWNAVAPWLPVHPPSPQGGQRRVPDRLCLNGIVFVLREGLRWQSLPIALGWGSGSTCWRRFDEWTAAGVWEAAHVALVTAPGEQGLLNLERAVIDSSSQRAVRGGAHTGPNPTDRAKKGCKRHLITDGQGLPLVAQTGPANRRDEQALPGLLWWLWAVLSYGWRCRPAVLQGDRGYGFPWSITLVLAWGIRSLLAVRGSPHGSGLGRTRYVVERTHSWFNHYRRLVLCYEQQGAHYQGFYQLAACLICAHRLRDGRQASADWQPFAQAA